VTATATEKVRRPGSELIPDDGVIDELVIELMLRGERRVRATRAERVEAALRIIDNGGGEREIRYLLNISPNVCETLMAHVNARLAQRVPLAG
jgi:hypothetical protein